MLDTNTWHRLNNVLSVKYFENHASLSFQFAMVAYFGEIDYMSSFDVLKIEDVTFLNAEKFKGYLILTSVKY